MADLRIGQTFDNRLLMDESWSTPEQVQEYLQPFAPGDPILIQFTTNYDPTFIKVQLMNQDGSIDPSGNFLQSVKYSYSDGSGNVVYNYLLDQSSVTFEGFRYVQITCTDPTQPPIQFISESFEFGDYAWLPYISWQNSDRDGIFWDDAGETIFGVRAEVQQKYTPSSESSMYEGFNFQPETLFAVPKRMLELTGNPMPRYRVEILELAFKHYNSWVNNVPYSANGASAKIAQIQYTNLYDFSIQLTQVDYENYSILEEITGTVIGNEVYQDYDNTDFADYDNSLFDGQF